MALPSCVESLLLEQNPTLLYLRNVCKELRVSSRSQGSTLPKTGLPRATFFEYFGILGEIHYILNILCILFFEFQNI